MKRNMFLIAAVMVMASLPTLAIAPQPDLKVRQYQFPPSAPQALRVQIANYGRIAARPCLLRLTVRRINGTAVGRTTEIKLPVIAGQQADWFVINASGILPNNVSLEDTTFRLDVDATDVVHESNEANNQKWHNL